MKNIIIAIVVVVLIGGLVYSINKGNVTEVTNIQPTATVQVIEKDALDERIREAQTSAEDQIEQDAEKLKQDAIHQANIEIELSVTTEYRKEIEAKEKELQAQSIVY